MGALRAQPPKVKIHAVGHSLGGGLAQQTGYQFDEVEQVYTFNTSPVTNCTSLRLEEPVVSDYPKVSVVKDSLQGSAVEKKPRNSISNEYPIIFRIYHTGELLQAVRSFTTTLKSSRFGRYDVGVQFLEKSFVKGHSMQILACGFADILVNTAAPANTGDDPSVAAHHYPISYVEKVVLPSNACCIYIQQRDMQAGKSAAEARQCPKK